MATITTDDVQHVATLARLEFNEEDIAQFTHQSSLGFWTISEN